MPIHTKGKVEEQGFARFVERRGARISKPHNFVLCVKPWLDKQSAEAAPNILSFSAHDILFFFLSPIFCFLSPIFCFFSSAQYSVCWATQQAVISCAHKNFQPMAIWCVMKLFQWLENGWCFLSRSSCDFFYFFTYTFPLNFDLLLA